MFAARKIKLVASAVAAAAVVGTTWYGAQRSPGAYMPLAGLPRHWSILGVHMGQITLARDNYVVTRYLDISDGQERGQFLDLMPMYAFDAYFVSIKRPTRFKDVVVVEFSQPRGTPSNEQIFDLKVKEDREQFFNALIEAGCDHRDATETRITFTWEEQMLKRLPLGLGRLVTSFTHGVRKMFC